MVTIPWLLNMTELIDTNWEFSDAGQYHSMAIKSDYSFWLWGFNLYGQCGLNDSKDRLIPIKLE